MQRQLGIVLVLGLALAACGKKSGGEAAPTKEPAMGSGTTTAVVPDPASVHPGSGTIAVTPHEPCGTVAIGFTATGLSVKHGDTVTDATKDTLDAVLHDIAAACTGTALVVSPASDTAYADIVAVMDLAVKHGFTDVAIETGRKDATKPSTSTKPAAAPSPDAMKHTPVVIVTTTDVSINDKHWKLDTANLGPELTAALKALPATGVPGTIVLQADQSTTGAVLNAIIDDAHAAGFDNVLFAVKNKQQ